MNDPCFICNSVSSMELQKPLATYKMIFFLTIFFCVFLDNSAFALLTAKETRDFELYQRGRHTHRNKALSVDNETHCDLFSGTWLHDTSYPLYNSTECPYITSEFNCRAEGRPDSYYETWKWQPHSCSIPRFNASSLLEFLRGKRLMFVGDSISENQFESLVCLIYTALPNALTPSNANHSVFKSLIYNASIELFWAPYLVELETDKAGKKILHVDEIENNGIHWKGVDLLVFESSKWWPERLGPQRWDIIMEGNKKYTNMEPLVAYKKALNTWSKWIDANLDPQNTTVFFRGTTFGHYDSRRRCDDTEPVQDPSYDPPLPVHTELLRQVLSSTDFPVNVLNITYSTSFRRDSHPSVYTPLKSGGAEDCTHWCLPGVPDSWNEILYALLLSR